MPATKKMTFPVDVELPEPKVRFICDQIQVDMTDGQKIAGVVQSAMDDLGEGGMVVSGKVMEQIHNLVGELADDQDLVRYIEAAKGMADGKLVIPWAPDPTYLPVLEDTANRQGIMVTRVGQDLMDYAASQGWLYALAPDTVTMFFTREDFRMLCEAFDKEHITGTEIADFIRQLYEQPAPEPVPQLEEAKQ